MSSLDPRWLITCTAGAVPEGQSYATEGAAHDVVQLHSGGCPGRHAVLPDPYVCHLGRDHGEWLATRAFACDIRDRIEAAAGAPAVQVVIDFSGVESATLGFLDELVCNLAVNRPVTVRGMNDDVAESINLAVQRRSGLAGRVTRA